MTRATPAKGQTALSSTTSYDLVFSGRLLAGTDGRQARLRLTAFFRLADPTAVEVFFRGGDVILRRALTLADAEVLCARLVAGGLDCRLAAHSPPFAEPEQAPAPETPASTPPNLFQIRRDLPPAQAPDTDALQLRFLATAVTTAIGACALIALLLVRLLGWSPTLPVTGPDSVIAGSDGSLLMLAGNRLLIHNRAGASVAQHDAHDLGLETLDRLLATSGAQIIVSGSDGTLATVWRCSLNNMDTGARCLPAADDPLVVESLTTSTLSDALYAVTADSTLLRLQGGQVRERRALPRNNPFLRLTNHRGLLMLNNSEGPGLGVYRPDAAAFGEQLDEILLLHPAAVALAQDRIADFAAADDTLWTLLTGDSRSDLYGFDLTGSPGPAVPLPQTSASRYLTAWRDRLLVYTPASLRIERVSAEGRLEAPLISDALSALAAHTRGRAAKERVLYAVGLLLVAIAVVIGGLLTWVRAHQRRLDPGRLAIPDFLLEHRLQQLRWTRPDPLRARVRRRWGWLAGAAMLLCIVSILTGNPLPGMPALPVLVFSLAAVHYLRLPAPQVGARGHDLALVDHRGVYQTGPSDGFRVWGPFVCRGGVIVCLGLPGLPGLEGASLPPATRRIDTEPTAPEPPAGHPAEVVARLLETRHPLLIVALALPVSLIGVTVWRLIAA